MSLVICVILTAFLSYLFGSLNSAIIVCRLVKKDDIRKYGSHNAGLTNVFRVYGKIPALLTILFDLAKGIIVVLLARVIVGNLLGIYFFNDSLFIGYVAGFSVVIGHVFPLYYKFKGGKGVLTAFTTLLAIDPITAILSILVFILIVLLTKYVSLGSIIAAISYPVFTLIMQTLNYVDGVLLNTMFAFLICLLIIYKHKANIVRLIHGTENKISFSKKSSD